MANFRRQLSVDECDIRNRSTPPVFRISFHGRTNSEDRSSIGSESGQRIARSNSQCSLTKRSFLRKRIVELNEIDGIKSGCRVVCFPENPQLGTIKWIGKINQIIWIGVEFDNPIGINTIPMPFKCSVQHSRLVSLVDLLLVTDKNGKTILSRQKHENFENSIQIQVSQAAQEFAEKLNEFHEYCQKSEDILDKLGGELDQSFSRRVAVDSLSISLALERHKSYLTEVEDRYSLIDLIISKSEELFTYDDILLPSEERKINRTIQELSNMHTNIETKLKRRIRDLEWAFESCQRVQDLLHEKLEFLSEAKAQLRDMEKSLIKTKSELSSRLLLIEKLMGSFSPTESEDLVEIVEKISQLHELTGNSPEVDLNSNQEEDDCPNNKFDSQLGRIMSMRNQLLNEIGTKYTLYKEAFKLFQAFTESVSSFEEWYSNYVNKIHDASSSSSDFQINLEFVKEREMKRKQFVQIFEIARQLRVSIFDPSVLDDRIMGLQIKWRNLMDVCYREKFRKML